MEIISARSNNDACLTPAPSSSIVPQATAAVNNPQRIFTHDMNAVLSPIAATTKQQQQHQENSSSSSPAAAAVLGTRILSNDSKIEIAGGREVYSQSRSKVGRHKAGGGQSKVNNCDVNVTYDLIEGYFCNPGLSVKDVAAMDKPDMDLLSQTPPVPPPMPDDDAFDNEEDDDEVVNPTGIDLEDEEEPGNAPHNTTTAAASMPPPPNTTSTTQQSSPVASSSSSSPNKRDPERVIGGLAIAEYEGSPRRYKPRGASKPDQPQSGSSKNTTPSPPTSQQENRRLSRASSNGSSVSNRSSKAAKRPPGFPQRVLPASSSSVQGSPSSTASTESSSPKNAAAKGRRDGEEEAAAISDVLLKFDEITKGKNSNEGQQQRQPQLSAPIESVIGGHSTTPAAATPATRSKNYDYQYEFSETRKVLDEFFHSSTSTAANQQQTEDDLDYTLTRKDNNTSTRIGQRLADQQQQQQQQQPQHPQVGLSPLVDPPSVIMDFKSAVVPPPAGIIAGSVSNGSGDTGYATLNSPEATRAAAQAAQRVSPRPGGVGSGSGSTTLHGSDSGLAGPASTGNNSKNFTLSPETTDCDSADLESEVSMNEGSFHSSGPKMHTAMPVLEDGLSSGHASDLEEDVIYSRYAILLHIHTNFSRQKFLEAKAALSVCDIQ